MARECHVRRSHRAPPKEGTRVNRPARRPTSGSRTRKRGAEPDVDAAAVSWDGAGHGRATRLRKAGDPDPRRTPASGRTERVRTAADRTVADRTVADRTAADRASTSWPTGRTARGRAADDGPGATRPRDAVAGNADGDARPGRGRRWFGGRGLRLRRPRRPGAQPGLPRRPVPVHIHRRRLAAGLAAATVLLVGVGVGTWLLLSVSGLANVEDVTVTGLSTVPEQSVRDAAAVTTGGPLIAVDTAGIAQRVAAVEGVASVYVRRAWPHTVEVNVTERVPVALWQNPQGMFEVDGTGLAYRRAPEPPPALPRLVFTGVAPQDPSTAAALAVLHDLTDPLRAQVATVDVAGTKVTLGLTDGRSVRWGDPDRSPDKIAVLGALLGQPGSVYDISSPDLPTVRP
jgi:cell division protein FtsQ